MSVKPGDTVGFQFSISDPATGAAVNADSLPTGTLIRNGDNTAEVVTITNISTGVYKTAVTIPAGYAAGDEVQMRITATVSTITAEAPVWGATLDSKRVADLQDLTAAQVNAEVDTALVDYDGPTKAEMDAAIGALGGSGVTVHNVVKGGEVEVYIGDTWDFDLTGLGDLSEYEAVGLAVKRRVKDEDAAAILYVRSDAAGLVALNEEAAEAADGVLTVGVGEVNVLVEMEATAGVTFSGNYTWWVKGWNTSADPDRGRTIATGKFKILRPGVKAVA